ncbi:D-alanyl-D-alanine carboxypeptidase [Streptomyces sp. NPDC102467]|uniref:D-alanyl-D-alanine carboxypeptidase n=1 Tax=Streptomyces sp. NPDC102467 TaxID=3366179 RepID=UPI003815DEB6
MAGTPDRSGEEQKASGGPARDEQDPRLAVARETPSRSGVDQATAVFSVRDVAETDSGSGNGSGNGSAAAEEAGSGNGSAPAEEAGSGNGSAPAEEAEDAPSASAEEPGDARLRNAVAAWVTSAAAAGAEARGETGAAGAEAAPSADVEPASDAEGTAAAADASKGADADAEPRPGAGRAATPEPGTDAEPQAEPADVVPEATAADAAAAAAAAAASTDGAAKPGAHEDADAEPQAEPGDVVPEAAAAAAPTGAEAEPKAGAAANDDAKPGAPEDADAEPEAEPAVGAETKPKPDTDAEPKAEPADAAPDAAVAAAPTGGAEAKPKAGADARAEAKPDAPKDAGTKAKADAAPKDAGTKAKADAAPKGAGADGPVDQPTAVFKAVAPPVDQPTTMLKSPGAKPAKPANPAKDAKDAKGTAAAKSTAAANGAASVKGGKPETEAERTSKFVPLKGLDSAAAPGTGKPAEPPVAERTTQQPLPPKPPLDLLAELTNTPPPPETRVRTTVRRVKVWTPLVLLLIVVFAVVQAVRPLPTPTLQLTAQESVSFDGGKPSVPWPGQGQAAMDVNGIGTFGTSGDQKPVPIASIAKVMTVYLILRDHPLKTGEKGPKIPVDAAAQKHYETGKAENESVVKVTEGQQISEYEALQAVMLPSANNIAKLLARWDTGESSEDTFVDKMNKTAKELGMKNTTYTDPSGLDKTTVSTAEDLVKLGRAAMENPVFKDVSSQPSYVDLNGDKQNNFFGLVPTVAIGIKTGTTTAAGGNILFAAEKKVGGKTQTIIGAALGQYGRNGTANIDEVTGVVRKLIESGQSALTAKKIVTKGDVVGQVDDGMGGTTPVVATKDVTAVGWSGLTVRLKLGEKKGETPPHAAKAGTEVGVLSVGDGKNDAVEVPVALQKDLAEPGFGAKIKRVG